jgi:hypothetical protein
MRPSVDYNSNLKLPPQQDRSSVWPVLNRQQPALPSVWPVQEILLVVDPVPETPPVVEPVMEPSFPLSQDRELIITNAYRGWIHGLLHESVLPSNADRNAYVNSPNPSALECKQIVFDAYMNYVPEEKEHETIPCEQPSTFIAPPCSVVDNCGPKGTSSATPEVHPLAVNVSPLVEAMD